MCGIFGICYNPNGEQEDFSNTQLLQLYFPAIVHRGPHAFGWMSFDGEKVSVRKHKGRADDMVNLAKASAPESVKWLVGHVRWATHGTVDVSSNNHPIIHGRVVGVHNGILRNHDEILDETGRHDPRTEVDSEAIFAAVNKWGNRAGLRKIRGDMVTVFTNLDRPNTLFIGRSHGRDLVIARTKARNLVFASEARVLRAIWGEDLYDMRTVKTNQLIRVVDGRVAETIEYQTFSYENVKGKPVHRIEVPAPVIDTRGITDRMSPPTPPKVKPRRRNKARTAYVPQGYRDGEEVRPGKYYYNGLLLSEDEYVAAIAAENGWD